MLSWLRKWLADWFARHRHPVSLILHAVGIPATLAGVVLAVMGHWAWAVVLFAGGYGLQFIGHILEGNRSGEELLFRKFLRRRGPPGGSHRPAGHDPP